MKGKLNPCFLFTYRVPAETCRPWLPAPLRPVTKGEWAFLSIFACGVEHFRPAVLPKWLGMNYHHVAYRIFVEAPTAQDKSLRGMYFLRSDVDHGLLAATGNWSSDLHFHYAKVQLNSDAPKSFLLVDPRDGAASANIEFDRGQDFARTSSSCFASNQAAQDFLSYQPIGITVDRSGKQLKLVEVLREGAGVAERPIRVLQDSWGFFETLGARDTQLELATEMTPVECTWKMGRREPVAAP